MKKLNIFLKSSIVVGMIFSGLINMFFGHIMEINPVSFLGLSVTMLGIFMFAYFLENNE